MEALCANAGISSADRLSTRSLPSSKRHDRADSGFQIPHYSRFWVSDRRNCSRSVKSVFGAALVQANRHNFVGSFRSQLSRSFSETSRLNMGQPKAGGKGGSSEAARFGETWSRPLSSRGPAMLYRASGGRPSSVSNPASLRAV